MFVDPDEPENFAAAITPKTKAIFAETLGNPVINVLGGHGTTLGGVLIESGRFPWDNGKFPGLPGDKYHELARKYVPGGASAVLTFGIRGGIEAGVKFIDSVQFLSHLANIGDARSLVIHPASTTHRQLSEEQLEAAGVSADMIRLSVGLETLDDILWDLDQALARAGG